MYVYVDDLTLALKLCTVWRNTAHIPHDSPLVYSIMLNYSNLFSNACPVFTQGEEGDKNAKMAIENPERFVVKPQREGGGRE